jgi:hypothetical protein
LLPTRPVTILLVLAAVLVAATPVGLVLLGRAGAVAQQAGPAGLGDSAANPGEGGAKPTGQALPGTGTSSTAAPADPFADTPAESWPSGAAGLAVPAAAAAGPWPAKDVADVLTRAKAALVGARLDPAVLQRGQPTAYLAQLAPSTRPLVTKAIASGEPAIGYVTRLATGYSLAAPVRVRGTITVSVGGSQQLVVTADVVWAYPLVGPVAGGVTGAGAWVVVLRTSETYEWYSPAKFGAADRGLRPGAAVTAYGNMDCAQVKKGLIGLPTTNQGGVSPDALFDPATRPDSLPTTC